MKTTIDPRIGLIEAKLTSMLEAGRERLYEHEIYEILGMMGFRVPAALFAAGREEAESLDLGSLPGERIVCKLISENLMHRFEYGGVRFVEKTAEAILETYVDFERICDGLGIELDGMMVAERIDANTQIQNELLLSLRQDASFGPVVFIGLGGVGTEVYKQYMEEGKDLLIRTADSISDYDGTERALGDTLFYPIITGKTRIKPDPQVDGRKIHEALGSFALLAKHFSPFAGTTPVTIEEIEINPIQVTPDGDLVPLDAMMRISGTKSDPLHPPQSGIKSLLEPRSVLIIGASATKMNAGRIILKNILEIGRIPADRIYCLHPEADEIEGCLTVGSIEELPGRADMAVFTIPATDRSTVLLEQLIATGKAGSITLIPGGFGETEKGKGLDVRVQAAIQDDRRRDSGGVVVNGPNCLGIVSKPGGYNTFFLPEYKLPFKGSFGQRSAFISQSGAYLVTLISNMVEFLNPEYMITYGNQMDLTVTDYLIYLKDDPALDLFVLYLEGFKPYDGNRFLKVAREIIESGKTIIMYKTGRTRAGAAAVASHTASMAGNYEILHRILTDAGVIMPDTLNEVEDAIRVFTLLADKKVTGRRVGIFANAGFECSVAADRLNGIELAKFSSATVRKLQEALPTDIIDINNPIDATPVTNAVNYGRCLEAMAADDGVDCIVAAVVAPTPFMETLPAGEGHNEDIRHADSYPNITIDMFRKTEKPMIVSINSGPLYDPAVKMMEAAGLPCFRKIDRAMKALDVFLKDRSRQAY